MKTPIQIYKLLPKHQRASVIKNLVEQFDGGLTNDDYKEYIKIIREEGYPINQCKMLAENALKEVALMKLVEKNLFD